MSQQGMRTFSTEFKPALSLKLQCLGRGVSVHGRVNVSHESIRRGGGEQLLLDYLARNLSLFCANKKLLVTASYLLYYASLYFEAV